MAAGSRLQQHRPRLISQADAQTRKLDARYEELVCEAEAVREELIAML